MAESYRLIAPEVHMAGLPRRFTRGLLVGAAAAVLWGVLGERRLRTALAARAVGMAGAVPYLGAQLATLFSAQLAGLHRAAAEDFVATYRTGEVLDLGSGVGYLAVEIGRRARDLQVTTVDESPYTVHLAEARIHTAGLGKQVKIAQVDLHDIPYPDGCFDAVLSAASLHRWSSPEVVLAEIHRVLRPNGRALIYDLRKEMPEEGWELLRDKLPPAQRFLFDVGVVAPWRASYSEGEIAALIARTPFRHAHLTVLPAEIAGTKLPWVTRVEVEK